MQRPIHLYVILMVTSVVFHQVEDVTTEITITKPLKPVYQRVLLVYVRSHLTIQMLAVICTVFFYIPPE